MLLTMLASLKFVDGIRRMVALCTRRQQKVADGIYIDTEGSSPSLNHTSSIPATEISYISSTFKFSCNNGTSLSNDELSPDLPRTDSDQVMAIMLVTNTVACE